MSDPGKKQRPSDPPKRGEHTTLAGLAFVVLHTKGGAVRWFKVSPAEPDGPAA